MINVAELLKDCPKGMELYSPIFGDVYLYSTSPYVISVTLNKNGKSLEQFICDGKYTQKGECMLFPSKEQRDWSKFQRPFKNGDVIYNSGINAISILRSNDSKKSISRAFLNTLGDLIINHYHSSDLSDWRFATEEEKAKLFKAIKDHNYKWNDETKTLEKLIEPKFKVGDIITNGDITSVIKQITKDSYILDIKDNEICFNYVFFEDQDKWELVSSIKPKFKVGDKVRHKTFHNVVYNITSIEEDYYACCTIMAFRFNDQDNYELVPNKFDINTLVPFESRVLVRDRDNDAWRASFWGCLIKNRHGYNYDTTRGYSKQCIPYEGNEHLLGKTDKCIDFYKIWK